MFLELYLYLYWYAGKCVTAGSLRKNKTKNLRALICKVCQFPWCKFFHHGHFQTTSRVAVNADLWQVAYNWFLWIHSSTQLYLLHDICHSLLHSSLTHTLSSPFYCKHKSLALLLKCFFFFLFWFISVFHNAWYLSRAWRISIERITDQMNELLNFKLHWGPVVKSKTSFSTIFFLNFKSFKVCQMPLSQFSFFLVSKPQFCVVVRQ